MDHILRVITTGYTYFCIGQCALTYGRLHVSCISLHLGWVFPPARGLKKNSQCYLSACLLLIFLSAPLLLGKIGAWGVAVQFRIVFPSYPSMLALYISYIRRYAAQLVKRLAESAINRST